MASSLPSWQDGANKSAILDFVARVTDEGGPDYVAPADRIATFDNDGTLWCEQPLQPQLYFARTRLEALAKADPSLRERDPFKAYLDHDLPKMKELGKRGLFEVLVQAHAGSTADEFDLVVRKWLAHAKNPQLGKRFTELTYRPQLELLELLHANEFRCFIVSGGGIDVIRGFSEDVYGIPQNQVVGSSAKSTVEERDGRIEVVKLAELNTFDDREVKVENIYLHIGRRPIFVFGNSDGDLAMLRYALTGRGLSLGLLLHHDDSDREFAYDREFMFSPLVEGLERAEEFGIALVSMKKDWNTVFSA